MVGKESGEMSWNMGSLRVAAPGESNEYLIIVYAKIPCVYIYTYVIYIYIYMMMILEPPTKMVDNKPPRGCGVSLHISIPPAPKKKKNTLHTVILKKCLRDRM